MSEAVGTIIAGAPRSGTTLALKILCDGITPREVIEGGPCNEPGMFWELITGWDDPDRDTVAEARERLPKLMQESRFHVIKCPYISPLFASLDPHYRVILTFRDLRLVVASMLNHKQTHNLSLTDKPYWAPMLEEPQDISKMNPVQRALTSAEMFTRHGVDYQGETQVWNYGFWDEWECNAKEIKSLYGRAHETPQHILDEVNSGVIFSNLSFTMDVWREACEVHKISKADVAAVEEANIRMVKLYHDHGFAVKTLDDVAKPTVLPSVTTLAELPVESDATKKFLQRIDETWGKPECPTDWIKLPSQRRWEYEITAKLLGLSKGARVLDAGGGQGYMSYIMSDQCDVLFNDRHDCYRQPAAPVQKIIGSFFTLQEEEKFDAIACVSVLEHVPAARRLDWLKKVHRLLRPGGVAVLTFEWSSTGVFDIGDGHTLSTAQLEKLWAAMPLQVAAQLVSPTRAENSRGWVPLAVRLVNGG